MNKNQEVSNASREGSGLMHFMIVAVALAAPLVAVGLRYSGSGDFTTVAQIVLRALGS